MYVSPRRRCWVSRVTGRPVVRACCLYSIQLSFSFYVLYNLFVYIINTLPQPLLHCLTEGISSVYVSARSLWLRWYRSAFLSSKFVTLSHQFNGDLWYPPAMHLPMKWVQDWSIILCTECQGYFYWVNILHTGTFFMYRHIPAKKEILMHEEYIQ